MTKKLTLLLCLLFTGAICLFLPKQALAFACISNGVAIGGTGTFTIPINVTLTKSTSNIILTDMSTYTSCYGQSGYNDALRTTTASISPILTGLGYSGFAVISGATYPYPIGTLCVWPDSACSTNYPNLTYTPLNVKIGMQKVTQTNSGATIPAGTEIARLSVQQRSISTWGWDKTWIFTLQNALVIPSYTCVWTNPNPTVSLPPVKKADLQANGVGRYPVAKPFNINLTCDPQTTVSIQLDGTTMAGKNNVLANASPGNTPAGIQVLYNNNPVVYGQRMQVIASSQAQESLAFNAYYYYNGGSLVPGSVSAVATVTLTYN